MFWSQNISFFGGVGFFSEEKSQKAGSCLSEFRINLQLWKLEMLIVSIKSLTIVLRLLRIVHNRHFKNMFTLALFW